MTVEPRAIEIVDDGTGCDAPQTVPAGNGLAGIAERAAAVGGRMVAGPSRRPGFRLRVEVPA